MEWSNLLWQPQWNKRLCSWALQFTSLLRLHSQRKYAQQQKRRYLVFFFSQKTRELCQVQKGKYWVTKVNSKSIHCLTGKQIWYEIFMSFILGSFGENDNNDVIKINALTYDRGLSIVMSLFNYAKGRTCFKICIYKDIWAVFGRSKKTFGKV